MQKRRRLKRISYSAPDHIAEKLKHVEGKKSDVITAALAEYFAKQEGKSEEEKEKIIAKGLTFTEIKTRIDDYMSHKYSDLVKGFASKMAEVKRIGNDPNVSWEEKREGDYERKFYEYREEYDKLNNLKGDDFRNWLNTLTMEELEEATLLSSYLLNKKVVPLLRKAGYKIVKVKK